MVITQELIIEILLNFIDYIMFTFLCYRIVNKTPKYTRRSFVECILYSIIMGACANFLHEYTYKIIVTIVIFGVIKYISNRKIYDVLMLYVIIFLCISFVQIMVILFFSRINISDMYFSLVVQLITLPIVIIMYSRIPVKKAWDIIERKILIKLALFTLVVLSTIVIYYFNDDYSNIESYSVYFAILAALAAFGIYNTLKILIYYTDVVPSQLHDVKNILIGLDLSANNTSDINVLRSSIHNAIDLIGIDNYSNQNSTDYNGSIKEFINQKKMKKNDRAIFINDISYTAENKKIGFSVFVYMLGVLIDNSLETNTELPIYVRVMGDEDYLTFSVSNEIGFDTDINKMFSKGYSTKSTFGRGHGLANLAKVAKKFKAEIMVSNIYEHEQKYIKIEIKTTGGF